MNRKEISSMKTTTHSLKLAALAGVAMLTATATHAVDFHVATAQDLQNALTVAANNGADNNIYLTNGYYIGNFNFNSAGGYNLTIQNEPSVTNNTAIALDGAGLGRDMNLSNTVSGNFTVQGITFLRNCGNANIGALRIAGGSASTILVQSCQFLSPTNSSGEGLELDSGLNATITNCVVTGSTSCGGGTGVAVSGVTGTVNLENCAIATNSAFGASISGAAVVNIAGNTITGNFDSCCGSGNGAGVNCAGTVTITGNTFTGNSSGQEGGGVYCSGTAASILGNTFTGNSGGCGGGVYGESTTTTISGNTFIGNSANGWYWGPLGNGGGVYCSGATATISNNIFSGNWVNASGGGVSSFGTTTMFIGNTFIGNSADDYSGGGVCCGGTATIISNTFTGNWAGSGGGGLYVAGPSLTLQDNLLVNNSETSPSSQGGGLWVDATSNLFMINNTIFGNTAAGSGGGAAFEVTGTVELLNVYNNIIWGNSASGNGADVWLAGTGQQKVFLYNDVNDMYGVWDIAQNLLNVDPQFFDPVNGDYHLRPTSPCANAGTNGAPCLPATDLDGNARTNGAGQVDLGCYEFNTTATHPADTNAAFVITSGEYGAYAAAWKNGQVWTNAPSSAPNPNPIPANYVTRAGYLMTNGGAYYNDGSARPTNWKPSQ
jgi:hypothetical protein